LFVLLVLQMAAVKKLELGGASSGHIANPKLSSFFFQYLCFLHTLF